MKNIRRKLPPLDGLVFFDAACRHSSFVGAATELCVTQAAVSKRIKGLESSLGILLFHREGRKIELTESGRRLFERTAMALDYLEEAIDREQIGSDDMIRIAANSAMSVFWLGPRLRDFQLGRSSNAISVSTSDRLRDLLDPANDFAITYGYGDVHGWDSALLFEEELVPVSHPDYLNNGEVSSLATIEDWASIKGITLLEYDRVAPDWVNWETWIRNKGAVNFRSCLTKSCGTYAHAIAEAIAGKGVALGSIGLIDAELSAGCLRIFSQSSLLTGRGYYLSTQRDRRLNTSAMALRKVLTRT